ncbi:MAG TPA: Na+/H+ antiporter [Nevskiaceae bacterium]
MASIEVVLAMLLAVLASGYLVRALPVALPLPLVQIVLGGVIAGVFHHGVTLQPEVFFLLFLPPLLFLDGWRIPKDGLLQDKGPILELAIGLVVFTVFGAGYLIHWMIPAMPLAVAFALAAIVSPTDPVAVSAITARVPIPPRLMHVLEGESLLNDASGLVAFQFAVAAAVTGAFSLGVAARQFLWVALVGVACGLVFTAAVAFVQHLLSRHFGEDEGAPILVSLLIPFGAYMLAEQLRASGILAAVFAGIAMSYVELSGRSIATTRLERTAVWNTIQFTLNGIMFVLLGEQLPAILHGAIAAVGESGHHNPLWLVFYALAITVILGVLRFGWAWVSVHLHLLRSRHSDAPQTRPDTRLILATSLAGVRGAVTLAGVLTLPLLLPDGTSFPARGIAVFLAAVVILFSLIAASVGLPILLKDLKLPEESTRAQERRHARAAAARAAIDAVRSTEHSIQEQTHAREADIVADAASRVIAYYQQRAERDDDNATTQATELRKSDEVERQMRLAALQAERVEVLRLARHHFVSDSTSRRLVRELDLLESLYR